MFGARAGTLLEPGLNTMGTSHSRPTSLSACLSTIGMQTGSAVLRPSRRSGAAATGDRRVVPDHGARRGHTSPGSVPLGGLAGLGWGSAEFVVGAEFVVDGAAIPELQSFHGETGIRDSRSIDCRGGLPRQYRGRPYACADQHDRAEKWRRNALRRARSKPEPRAGRYQGHVDGHVARTVGDLAGRWRLRDRRELMGRARAQGLLDRSLAGDGSARSAPIAVSDAESRSKFPYSSP